MKTKTKTQKRMRKGKLVETIIIIRKMMIIRMWTKMRKPEMRIKK